MKNGQENDLSITDLAKRVTFSEGREIWFSITPYQPKMSLIVEQNMTIKQRIASILKLNHVSDGLVATKPQLLRPSTNR